MLYFNCILHLMYGPLDKSEQQKSYFPTKTYVVVTQKKRLNETVILSTQNLCYTDGLDIIYNFTLKYFVHLNLWMYVSMPLPHLALDTALFCCFVYFVYFYV